MSIELKQAAQQALEALLSCGYEPSGAHDPTFDGDLVDSAIEALRTAIQQAEAHQPATANACGVPGMAKTTCPYCEQGFAFEYEQPATPEPVAWMHWLHGPVHVYMNKDEAAMELERLNREYPSGADDRKMRPLVFGDTYPAPSEPTLIEKAISSGYFGLLPVKATIPMCKAGWGASGGELTFQQIGHIYEEMYKARPLLDTEG